MKTLCRWMGAGEDTIKDLIFEALKSEASPTAEVYQPKIEFTDKQLPEGAMPLLEWSRLLKGELNEQVGENFVQILSYLIDRGYDNPFDYDFYWSPSPGYIDRVIIPFCWEGRLVGNTARKITDGRPKYISDQHPNFVFNFNQQNQGQRYILVVEGPFDALSVNGVALLTNEISEQQSIIINSLGAEVIVIPDQDRAGLVLFDRAEELGWHIASPNWDPDVKDCAEACKRYGSTFVVIDAIKTSVQGKIKINMAKRQLLNKLENNDND
jgi:hypothetical protein